MSDSLVFLLLIYVAVLVTPLFLTPSVLLKPYGLLAGLMLTLPLSIILLASNEFSTPLLSFNHLDNPHKVESLLQLILVDALYGILLLLIGYFAVIFPVLKHGVSQSNDFVEPNDITVQRAYRVLAWISIAGIAAFIAFSINMGGIFALYNKMIVRSRLSEYGAGIFATYYVIAATQLMPIGTIIWAAYGRKPFQHGLFWVHLLASCLILFSQAARSPLFQFLIIIAIVTHMKSHGFNIPFRRMLSLICGLVVFPFLAFGMLSLRLGGMQNEAVAEAVLREDYINLALDLYAGRDFIDAETLLLIYDTFPSEEPYQFGGTFVAPLFAPIPRILWPNKPSMPGALMGKLFLAGDSGGFPPSLIGELYLNYGTLGVACGMFLIGAFLGVIHRATMKNRLTPAFLVIYAVLLMKFLYYIVSASFYNSITKGLGYVMPLILCVWYINRARDKSSNHRKVVTSHTNDR